MHGWCFHHDHLHTVFVVSGYASYVTFLDFRLSRGSVATYSRWGGILWCIHSECSYETLVKEFWKSVHICQSHYQTSSGLLFWESVYGAIQSVSLLSVRSYVCAWHLHLQLFWLVRKFSMYKWQRFLPHTFLRGHPLCFTFLPRDKHKRGICCHPVSVCPSVCPSRSWVAPKRIKISSKFFHHLVDKPF